MTWRTRWACAGVIALAAAWLMCGDATAPARSTVPSAGARPAGRVAALAPPALAPPTSVEQPSHDIEVLVDALVARPDPHLTATLATLESDHSALRLLGLHFLPARCSAPRPARRARCPPGSASRR